MSHFGLNLGQTAEDSEMFTNNWLSSKGLTNDNNYDIKLYTVFDVITELFAYVIIG